MFDIDFKSKFIACVIDDKFIQVI